MKRTKSSLLAKLLAGALLAVGGSVFAAGGHVALPYKYEPDLGNESSLQRGAANYMNYCAGCHSMRLLRYGRLGQDLGIPEELLKANLMFTSEKPGDSIHAAMPAQAAKWFGQQPPDLSVETRLRGPAWVYNYLMTFYVDTTRPLGTNNLVLAGASMPHVLWELQGWRGLAPQAEGEDAHGAHAKPKFVQLTDGKLSEKEFQKFVADTVNFMAYAAEPGRAGRISLGMKVMLFLLLFTALAYLLKREYWRDVH
ncbi:MAG TPA: cytochrome c1 [Solimonas sp.]